MILRGSSTGEGLVIGSGGARTVPALSAETYEIDLNSAGIGIGHSLLGPVADYLDAMVASQNGDTRLVLQHKINGAPLQYNWDNAASAEVSAGKVNGRTWLGSNSVDYIWATESSPWKHVQGAWTEGGGAPSWNTETETFSVLLGSGDGRQTCDVRAWADWHDLARSAGATRFFVHQPWINYEGPYEDGNDSYLGYDWDERCEIEARLGNEWKSYLETGVHGALDFTDTLSAGMLGVHVIPTLEFILHAKDLIDTGTAPGIPASYTSWQSTQFYIDTVHLNHHGWYGLACLAYAVIYRQTPVGLPHVLSDRDGGLLSTPKSGEPAIPQGPIDATEAAWWQAEAWAFANSHPLTGL